MQPVLLVKESPLTSVSFLSEPRGPGSPRGPMGPSTLSGPWVPPCQAHLKTEMPTSASHQLGSSLLAGHLPGVSTPPPLLFSLCSPDSVQKPENLKVQVDHVPFLHNLQTASQLTENKSHILASSPRPLPLDSWPPLGAPDALLLLLLLPNS